MTETPPVSETPALLEIDDLSVRYGTADGSGRAVDGVSLRIAPGAALGLVGESGSGKSTVAAAILDLMSGGARIETGRIRFQGADLATLPPRQRRALLGARIGTVFQDPFTSLTPTLPVGRQIAEPLIRHRRVNPAHATRRVHALLAELGVMRPEAFAASRKPLAGERTLVAVVLNQVPGDLAEMAGELPLDEQHVHGDLRREARAGLRTLHTSRDR